ncbi:ribonuclease Z [Malassezia yamatoensis]|uniref:ribonuclease Z n=1 Tax=Malassezia yamatoensis TaxID=253288 RepID=A0AAJ5YTG3_9BASI|nr:ribonuclease Z [Malassezia yamatoensis]
MADGGKKHIHVHGPTNTRYALATSRFYAKRESMTLDVTDISSQITDPCFQDENAAITAIPLRPLSIHAKQAFREPSSPSKPKLRLDSEPWRNPKWSPSNLSGKTADEWLSLVLKDAWGSPFPSDGRPWTPSRIPYALPSPVLSPCSKESRSQEGKQAPVLCYIWTGADQRGKFDLDRAAALGIRPGKDYAQLSRGEDVTIQRPTLWSSLSDEQRSEWLHARKRRKKTAKSQRMDATPDYELEQVLVESRHVVGATRSGPVFFYMTLPSLDYVDSLLEPSVQQSFLPYTQETNRKLPQEQRKIPHVIIHAAPPDVIEDPRYIAWMQSFGPDCYHLIANRDHCADRLMYTSNALTLLRLSQLNNQMYTVPGYTLDAKAKCSGEKVMPVAEDMMIPLQPRSEPRQLPAVAPRFDLPMDTMHTLLDQHADQEAAAAWHKYQAVVKQVHAVPNTTSDQLADHLTFTTLGTGSSAPSKYRNVLSTLVNVPGMGYILLDAGEGTYYQLSRRFGPGDSGWDGIGVDQILQNLKMVFVSHIHGDHHMGVVRLLLERRKLHCSQPLYLFANNYTLYYLREYHKIECLDLDRENGIITIDNEHINPQSTSPRQPASNVQKVQIEAKQSLQMQEICSVPVLHRTSHCYGLVLHHVSGWKLVFSGDTMPCPALVQAGKNATVLIHEATMQDDQQELAKAKGHSTIGQAIQTALDMQAQSLLLTHFSQRYPKFARIDFGANELPIGIAFDQMHITPKQIRLGRHQLPALQALFAIELQEDQMHDQVEDDASMDQVEDHDASMDQVENHDTSGNQLKDPSSTQQTATQTPIRTHWLRENSTAFPWHYVVLGCFSRNLSQNPMLPSELAVHQGISHALRSMHGTVGSAFAWDLLMDVVIRVPSEHLNTMLSSVAAMDLKATNLLTQNQDWHVHVQNVSHNLAMLTGNAREWLASLLS